MRSRHEVPAPIGRATTSFGGRRLAPVLIRRRRPTVHLVRRCRARRFSVLSHIPNVRVLHTADLIAISCPIDDRCHLVDDRQHAEELAACADGRVREPCFRALCAQYVTPDSLFAAPRPACRDCLRVGDLRIQEAVATLEPARGRSRVKYRV